MDRRSLSGSDISSMWPVVHGIVCNLTRGAGDAEDITQEIMLKLLTSKAVPAEVRPGWLFKVARNSVIDARRQKSREFKFLNRNLFVDACGTVCERSEDERPLYSPSVSYRDDEIDSELWPAVKNAVSSLSEPLREVLLMWVAGYSYHEIACATKANIGTVRSRLHYARKRTRQLLRDVA